MQPKVIQQVLMLTTDEPSLRSEVWGWNAEDPSIFVSGTGQSKFSYQHIGKTPAPRFYYYYGTVMAAMSEGWKLLAPPDKDTWKDDPPGSVNVGVIGKPIYQWWLVRDASAT